MNDCGVCVGNCDDPMQMISETKPRCRVPFACCECRRLIPKGEFYEKHVGKYEGDLLTYRTCLVCVEIRNAFCCKGWLYESLWEELEEYGFPGLNEVCFAKLQTVEAKRYLRERWIDWRGMAKP